MKARENQGEKSGVVFDVRAKLIQ